MNKSDNSTMNCVITCILLGLPLILIALLTFSTIEKNHKISVLTSNCLATDMFVVGNNNVIAMVYNCKE